MSSAGFVGHIVNRRERRLSYRSWRTTDTGRRSEFLTLYCESERGLRECRRDSIWKQVKAPDGTLTMTIGSLWRNCRILQLAFFMTAVENARHTIYTTAGSQLLAIFISLFLFCVLHYIAEWQSYSYNINVYFLAVLNKGSTNQHLFRSWALFLYSTRCIKWLVDIKCWQILKRPISYCCPVSTCVTGALAIVDKAIHSIHK